VSRCDDGRRHNGNEFDRRPIVVATPWTGADRDFRPQGRLQDVRGRRVGTREPGSFQEFFGYYCLDAGFVPGLLGQDIDGALFIETGRTNLWPVTEYSTNWDEDTLFDMVEFLFRCVSVGIEESGRFHSFSGCGWHFNRFDQLKGRGDYRTKVNRILGSYGDGFELTGDGCVERRLPEQVAQIAQTPTGADQGDEEHIAEAVRKYTSRVGLDRRDAVRDLADVLERLRPLVKEHMFTKDQYTSIRYGGSAWQSSEQRRRSDR